MTIKKEEIGKNYKIVFSFCMKNEIFHTTEYYSVLKETDEYGMIYLWVVNQYFKVEDIAIDGNVLRYKKIEDLFDFIKSDDFNYGQFSSATKCDKDILQAHKEQEEKELKNKGHYDHQLGVPQDGGAWAEDAGILGWDLDS